MATHSSILAGGIPWTEDPGGLWSIGLQRVRHYWSDLVCMNTLHFNFRRKIICCLSIHVWGVMHDWQHLTLSIRVYLKYLLQKLFLHGPCLCPSGRSMAHPPLLWTGIREQSPSSWNAGHNQKGGLPLTCHAPHAHGEAGATPFLDDLLLGRGLVCSSAAPLLRSIGSQPSIHKGL